MIFMRKSTATWIRLAHVGGSGGARGYYRILGRGDCRPSDDQICTPCTIDTQSSELSLFHEPALSFNTSAHISICHPGTSWRQETGLSKFGFSNCRTVSTERDVVESSESTTVIETEVTESVKKDDDLGTTNSPLQFRPTPQSTLDLRMLINSKERELEILKSALRDKELGESLLQKHNIKLDPANVFEFQRERSSKLSTSSFSWTTPLPSADDQPWQTPTPKYPSSNGPDSLPLGRKRRTALLRQATALRESQEAQANSPYSLRLKAAAEKAAAEKLASEGTIPSSTIIPSSTESNPEVVESLSSTDGEEKVIAPAEEKPYRSLADRLYEEQFGHPAPANLQRTYRPGSFYDRCQKEKQRKDREAAAAAAASSETSPENADVDTFAKDTSMEDDDSKPKTSFRERGRPILSARSPSRNSTENQEMKPGDWKCPECSFHNFSKNMQCYKCQAERPEDDQRDRRSSGRTESSRDSYEASYGDDRRRSSVAGRW